MHKDWAKVIRWIACAAVLCFVATVALTRAWEWACDSAAHMGIFLFVAVIAMIVAYIVYAAVVVARAESSGGPG